MTALFSKAAVYLDRLLPGYVHVRERVVPDLPYFLLDAFDFQAASMVGQEVLLVALKPADAPPGDLLTMLAAIHAQTAALMIYVADGMDARQRRRLIEAGVSLLVPGNQLFAPAIALDLRERFRSVPVTPAARLSPATQAILISVLLGTDEVFNASASARRLGYTAMTASRATRELALLSLADTERAGKNQRTVLRASRQHTWEQARQYMASPVVRTLQLPDRQDLDTSRIRLAGETALSRLTMVTAGHMPTYAIDHQHWRTLREAADNRDVDAAPGIALQIWSYTPLLGAERAADTVDPLSLIVSIEKTTDPRLEAALRELERQLWT